MGSRTMPRIRLKVDLCLSSATQTFQRWRILTVKGRLLPPDLLLVCLLGTTPTVPLGPTQFLLSEATAPPPLTCPNVSSLTTVVLTSETCLFLTMKLAPEEKMLFVSK